MTTTNAALNPAIETGRAKQAVRILRQWYTAVLDPHLRAKAKAVPEHSKYLLSVKRYLDRSDKALDAINNLACEVEGLEREKN